MKTYDNIDAFIIDVFWEEYKKNSKQEKTSIMKDIDKIDALFTEELEEALKGKKEEQKG